MGVISGVFAIEKMAYVAISSAIEDRLEGMLTEEVEGARRRVREEAKRIIREELENMSIKTQRDIATGETIITLVVRSK